MMMTRSILNKIAVLMLVMMFVGTAYSQVLVSVNPVKDSFEVFPNEEVAYKLTLLNMEERIIPKMVLRVTSNPGILLIENESQKTELVFEPQTIAPNEQIEYYFGVRAKEFSDQGYELKVEFGEEVFTHSISTLVKVQPNPVKVVSRIERSAISAGEDNWITIDLENTGTKPLSGLKAEMILPKEGFEAKELPVMPDTLGAGQSINNSRFVFSVEPGVEGSNVVGVRLSYTINGDKHVIDNTFDLDVGERGLYTFFIIGIIVALIAVVMFFGGKKKLPEIKEGEEQPSSS